MVSRRQQAFARPSSSVASLMIDSSFIPWGLLLLDQLAQHVGQDAAVPVVVDLNRRINAQRDGHFFRFAVAATDDERNLLSRLDLVLLKPCDVERLRAVEL